MKKIVKRIGFTVLVLFVLLNIMSAFHAYKFTHFYSDAPPIKKPEQMGFGEKASAIFFGVQYPKSKVVDYLLIPHETLVLKTEDSLKLSAWLIKENITTSSSFVHKGTIIMFHGHGSSKSGMIREANAFYRMGYEVLMVDFRAHGNSDGNMCSIGYYESKDVKAAYDFVKNRGEKNIVLWGVSLGASSIIKSIQDYTLTPNKVILEMPFGSLSNAIKGRLKIMGLPVQPMATLLGVWGGVELGLNAFNHNPGEYAKKITAPVLLQWGKQDPRVTEAETDSIFANISSKQKQLVKYENCGHVSLCKNENTKWLATVGAFLN